MKVWKIILGTALYIAAIIYGSRAHESLRYTQILLDKAVTGAEAMQIQEQEWNAEEPMGFCFWGQSQKQMAACRETGGTAAVTPVFLSGNPALMDAEQLAWQDGCLVDRKTARALFGTASVGSQVLWFQETPYPVLGITEASRPTVVLMAKQETELDRMVLAVSAEQGRVEGKQCLLRWGIQGTVLDSTLLWSLMQNSLLLFPFLLCLMVCTDLGKGWRGLRWDGILYGGQRQLLGKLAVCVALFFGTMWLLGSHIRIPKSMIPTQWSDFSFWNRWWQAEKENAVTILFAPMGNRQLQMRMDMVKSGISNLFACLVQVWPARR